MAGLAALWIFAAGLFFIYAVYAAIKGSKLGILNTRNKAIIIAVISPFIWFIGTGILAVNDHSTPKQPTPPSENSIAGLIASSNQPSNMSTPSISNSMPSLDTVLSDELINYDKRIIGAASDGNLLKIYYKFLPDDIGGVTEALTTPKNISIYLKMPVFKTFNKIEFIASDKSGNDFGKFIYTTTKMDGLVNKNYGLISDVADEITLTSTGDASAKEWCQSHISKKICRN